MRTKLSVLFWVLTVMLLPLEGALGQVTQGSIRGVVRDASGAVVAGADVTLTKTETGATRTTLSNEAGLYVFPVVDAATYELKVQLPGFKTYDQKGIVVRVAENISNDINLQVGEITQVVTVEGLPSIVGTASSEVQTVIDETRMVEIPLNGRNVLSLLSLGPTTTRSTGYGGNSIDGLRGEQNVYQLDGGSFGRKDYTNSNDTYPVPEAVTEFTLQRDTFKADTGSGAHIINAITRSGTNKIRFDAWEFLRNQLLDARSFFAASKGKYRYNQFGFDLGMPIVKDKLFVYGYYEGIRNRGGTTSGTATVPTVAQRAGQMPGPVIDPLTGQNFPGNVIPSNRFSPIAKSILAIWPLPNNASNPNLYVYPTPGGYNRDQFMVRVDWQISKKHSIFVRHMQTYGPASQSGIGIFGYSTSTNHNGNLRLNSDYSISSTLLNEFGFTYDRQYIPSTANNQGINMNDLGFQFSTADGTTKNIFPYITLPGLTAIGQWQMGNTTATNGFDWSDSLSKVWGNHTLRFGGEFAKYQHNFVSYYVTTGEWGFSGQTTGSPFAEFLLGIPSSFFIQSTSFAALRAWSLQDFVQDDWKVNKHLTVNLGVRYEFWTPNRDIENRGGIVLPTDIKSGIVSTRFPGAPPGYFFPGDPEIPRWMVNDDYKNIAPRFGMAYDLFGDGKWAIRAGGGIYYSNIMLGRTIFFQQAPFLLPISMVNPNFANVYSTFPGGNPFPYTPGAKAFPWQTVLPTSPRSVDQNYPTPSVFNWNVTLEHQLAKDYLLKLSYVGSKGMHLPSGDELDPALCNSTNPAVDCTSSNINQRRLYAPYYGSVYVDAAQAYSNYQAGTVTLDKRLSKDFTVLASYTFAHSIDEMSTEGDPQIPTVMGGNLAMERGLATSNVKHRFVASWVWNLPNVARLNNSGLGGKMLSKVVNGWELSSIDQLQSGYPFSVKSGLDNSRTGVGADRPNLVGTQQTYGDQSRGNMVANYFNYAAYAQNAPGKFGNLGRDTLIGPGLINCDVGIFKNFRIDESRRIQFRSELYNAFNRPNFSMSDVSLAGGPNITKITSVASPRVIQFGLKFIF